MNEVEEVFLAPAEQLVRESPMVPAAVGEEQVPGEEEDEKEPEAGRAGNQVHVHVHAGSQASTAVGEEQVPGREIPRVQAEQLADSSQAHTTAGEEQGPGEREKIDRALLDVEIGNQTHVHAGSKLSTDANKEQVP